MFQGIGLRNCLWIGKQSQRDANLFIQQWTITNESMRVRVNNLNKVKNGLIELDETLFLQELEHVNKTIADIALLQKTMFKFQMKDVLAQLKKFADINEASLSYQL